MKLGNFWILKPYESFGNRAEDLYYGLLKCRREGLRLIILKRKWDLFSKIAFRKSNIAILNINHRLIVKNQLTWIIDICMSIWLSICRVLGVGIRKLLTILKIKTTENFLFKWSEVEIGRDGIWGDINKKHSQNYHKINWGSEHRRPIEVSYGSRKELNKFFPELIGKKYICMHIRDGGFFNDHKYSAPRNANIKNYFDAIAELVRLDYIVVRLGDPHMPKIQIKGLLDYAHHLNRNESNDILLVEHCEAYIGSLTGPIDLACLFEKRILTVNTLSIGHCTWYRKGSLFIPKKAKIDGVILSLKEQIDLNFFEIKGNGHMDSRVEYLENDSEEILAATVEFIQKLELNQNQKNFNLYYQNALYKYMENTQIWDTNYADTVQKLRWVARIHTVDGSVTSGWLEKNW